MQVVEALGIRHQPAATGSAAASCAARSLQCCNVMECQGQRLVQDVTPAEEVERDPVCDRTVVLYGYARGRNFTQGQRMHLAGVGDFSVCCCLPPVVELGSSRI